MAIGTIKIDESVGWVVLAPDGEFLTDIFKVKEKAIESFMHDKLGKDFKKHFLKKGYNCFEVFRRPVQ